jgi:predicted ATPase
LGRLAETSSVVLVMEDLHWADRSTLDLLSFVARNLGSMRVMVIGTYRSDEMRRTHALRPVLGVDEAAACSADRTPTHE